MRKLMFLQYAVLAVVMALFGLAAFGLLMVDFLFPGTFKDWYLFQGGMQLNLVLLLMFGLQHSVMARRPVKQFLGRLMPEELVLSTYVMISGFTLFVLAALWSPMAPPLYDLRGTVWEWPLLAGPAFGAVIVAWTGFLMGGKDLIGLGSVLRIWREEKYADIPFSTPGLYKYVRHPLYFGVLLVIWITPSMTHDHLFFSEVMTAYTLIGIWFEERDLVRRYGEDYVKYQRRTPMLIPFLKLGKRA